MSNAPNTPTTPFTPTWMSFPHAGECNFDAQSVLQSWARLHVGDAEPPPDDPKVCDAWALFHSGEFEKAVQAGLQAGGAGITVANKAACIYANHLEKMEKIRLDMYLEVAQRAQAQAEQEPENANAWYWQAYALGRYSQGISVAKALAQGIGSTVKLALETTIRLQPLHADAHLALGGFHAEVIDKVGALIGSMTYGAKKEVGLKLFQEALKLNPGSAIGMIEHAHALMMLEGEQGIKNATHLYQQAAASEPLDAMEWLDVDMAKAELDE